jgi:hypothetical protein
MEGLLTRRVIEERLIPMLAASQSADAATLARSAWDAIAPLLVLTDDERAYVESISTGEARTTLLFPRDAERAERAAKHPAIQWKLRNVRRRLAEES